ncbi:MFS transporter [Streptomyces pseudovenezuelae]|uniref:MFS family permease n=1 Tax=Streptomyces pseudovenezuelae TaxID=67350 RepID=A0ABT6M2J8_9ACTN|nr:MFS transporter [Streptomyces pseudovenezuelae]MDH6222747.1 MFS family permease [Streptomyces pseudovenezuelae]
MTASDEPLPRTTPASPPTAEERVGRDLTLYNNGLAVGVLGGAISSVALPSLALITLKASPFEMSVLYAAQRFPPAVTALFGGAVVDRHPKLALLTWGKAAGGVLLLMVPLGAFLGFLSLPLLCVVGLLLAAVNDVSSTAGISYLPSIAKGERLAAANSKLGALFSFTDAAGSYLASALIALLGTSRAVLADVASYAVSAWCMTQIRTPEPPPRPQPEGSTLLGEIREGLAYTIRHPVLWPVVKANTALALALTAWDVLFLIYVVRQLQWSPVVLAVVMGCASVGGVAGALAGRRLAQPYGTWWGVGPLLLCALALQPLVLVPVLFAGPGLGWQVVIGGCVTARFMGATAHGSTQRSVRQGVCKARFQGRQHAVGTWLTLGPRFLSALAAGGLVSVIGLLPSMSAAALATSGGFIVLLLSPIRRLRAMPTSTGA